MDMKWFTDLDEWLSYVAKYMAEAVYGDSSFHITVRDGHRKVIAKWSKDGSGQVFEKRSQSRLDGLLN